MSIRPFKTHREDTLQAGLYTTTWMLTCLTGMLARHNRLAAVLAGLGAGVGLAAIVDARKRGLPGM